MTIGSHNDESLEQTFQSLQLKQDRLHFHDDIIREDEDFDLPRSLKMRLLQKTPDDCTFLKDLLTTRMDQQGGETLFELGVEDDGTMMQLTKEEYTQCVDTLKKLAGDLGAEAVDLDTLTNTAEKKKKDDCGHVMVRKRSMSVEDMLEVRVAVVGNVDAGKSTLLGVLTKGILDDGRGKARVNLFRHPHEIESGRTSSVGGEILGFDAASQAVVAPSGRKLTSEEVCAKASKLISFVDLAGHEKYLKTTVFGMTGNFPDFVMLIVGGNAGMIGMAKEHLGLALSLSIPVFVVVTKVDRTPPQVLAETIKTLRTLLKSKSCQKFPLFVKTNEDVVNSAQHCVSARLCPIFQISNVTGEGLDLLRNYLNILPSITSFDTKEQFHYEITETYSVPFVGTVVSGVLKSGLIHVGDKVLVGPDHAGEFVATTIKGIQRRRVTVPVARAGQSVTFALKNIRRKALRKGMVLLHYEKDAPMPKVSRRFEAEIRILYHSTTIKEKYQAMVHCGSVRQTASIIHLDKQVLRTGDKANVQFEFAKFPEYLLPGAKLLFREGRTKGKGVVLRLL